MHIYELSGENYDFSLGELAGALEAGTAGFEFLERDFPGVVVDSEIDVGNRLGLCHNVYEHIFSCDFEELDRVVASGILSKVPVGRFRVRANIKRELDLSKRDLESKIGKYIDGTVDLAHPEHEVWALVANRIHVGLLRMSIDRKALDSRKVQNRPFFSPVSLHPKYARAMVNLSRVKKGDTVLDPFCGTGGILIEAAKIGMDVIGSDIKAGMVEGSRQNLEHFKLEAKLLRCDVSDIARHVECVDAVATDPPYGRSSSTAGRDADKVIDNGFAAIKDILKRKGYASIVLPNEKMVEVGEGYMKLVETYPIWIHKSLTRHFCVYRKE